MLLSVQMYAYSCTHCTVLIILNAATTVTANNQFNNHDQNLGGGSRYILPIFKKQLGGGGARATPCPTHLQPMLFTQNFYNNIADKTIVQNFISRLVKTRKNRQIN